MRGVLRTTAVALATGGAALASAAAAAAVPVVDGEFPLPAGQTVGANNEITQGPDGNMWVTSENNAVVRFAPDGTPTAFPIANTPAGITAGPDNNLWVTTTIGVIKVDPATGTDTAYDVDLANGAGIVGGPDGNLWAVGGDELVRFSPADPSGTNTNTIIAGMSGKGMSVGTDGLLWIADGAGRVISATAADAPAPTPYDVGFGPQDVAGGANAQVAWANPLSSPHQVGLLTPGGTPQPIPIDTSDPFGIVFGQDGAYWVARGSTDDLLRLTVDGQTSTLGGFSPSGNVGPRKLATGPNNTLWVTLDTQEAVARVSGVKAGGGASPEPDTTIDKKPKRKLKTKKRRAKAKFRFSSSDPAATFECKLERKRKPSAFRACSSPKKYKLKPGKYRFQVRAVATGVTDPTPARHRFKVVRKRA